MERDLEKDLIEIECAIKSQLEKDNIFTVSVLQRCHKLVAELKNYRDLDEQGKLLKLPCAVGNTVWCVHMYSGGGRIPNFGEIFESKFSVRMYDDFGKTVFLTKEEAEAALKEMNGTLTKER